MTKPVAAPDPVSTDSSEGALERPLVSVCICTYRRPALLKRSLEALSKQSTEGRFTYSVVVADNDCDESARRITSEFSSTSAVEVTYCVEPEQNIALARNKAVQSASGDYVALIDDDEFPVEDWLAKMLEACSEHRADGVLGPVRPFFDDKPPDWLVRGRLCERPEHQTGLVLQWWQTRTGNVLFRREILTGIIEPFRREFGNGGEDQDFFRRMMERGHRFVWCNEAAVYEVVPAERRSRRYFWRRALLRGQNEKLLLNPRSIAKSLLAVPFYLLSLPFVSMLGEHVLMDYSVRLLDHAGKLLVAVGVKPIRGKYLNG